MSESAVGQVIAGLRIEHVVGEGGMGVVYRAYDPGLQRVVAVKVIARQFADDPTFRERFRREAMSAASLNHPNVIPVYGAGEDAGRLYLVMQYAEGVDLRAVVEGSGRLEPERSVRIVGQVASALDAAHRKGLVHRDVKPANVLVVGMQDGVPHAYLTDFGLSRPVAAIGQITETGAVLGTLDYMAPELFDGGAASAGSDVYALGCLLFHALAGRVPYPNDNPARTIHAHAVARPPQLPPEVAAPEVVHALNAVVARALAKRAGDRFPTAGALAAAAVGALQSAVVRDRWAETADAAGIGAPAPPRPAGPLYVDPSQVETVPEPPTAVLVPREAGGRRRATRRIALAAAATVVAGVVAGGSVYLATRYSPAPTVPAVVPASTPDRIVLQSVADQGDTVTISWQDIIGVRFAVVVAAQDGSTDSMLVDSGTSVQVPVDPEQSYCFRVRGTDGRRIYESEPAGIRGASCTA